MELRHAEEIRGLLDSCISLVKWRLRTPAKRRLETDVLALCARLRAVVMVDYGGKMPELQVHLCALMASMRKAKEIWNQQRESHTKSEETEIFLKDLVSRLWKVSNISNFLLQECALVLPLRIMVIEDMIYIVHAEGLAELCNLSLQQQLHFVNLEVDPPQLLLQANQTLTMSGFLSVQKLFSSLFQCDHAMDTIHGTTPPSMNPMIDLSEYNSNGVSIAYSGASQPCEIIELTSFLKDTEITIPVLNGWLLGYPVVYMFSKEHAADAVYNLSTQYLHIYKILICRHQMPSKKSCEEELLSFTVPYELSLGREKELWAEAFFSQLLAKLETCKQVWSSIRMEVTQCYPQAIIL